MQAEIILTLLFLRFDVLQENARSLNQLDVDEAIIHIQNACKGLEHVLLD